MSGENKPIGDTPGVQSTPTPKRPRRKRQARAVSVAMPYSPTDIQEKRSLPQGKQTLTGE